MSFAVIPIAVAKTISRAAVIGTLRSLERNRKAKETLPAVTTNPTDSPNGTPLPATNALIIDSPREFPTLPLHWQYSRHRTVVRPSSDSSNSCFPKENLTMAPFEALLSHLNAFKVKLPLMTVASKTITVKPIAPEPFSVSPLSQYIHNQLRIAAEALELELTERASHLEKQISPKVKAEFKSQFKLNPSYMAEFIVHMLNNGKSGTWEQIAKQTGLTPSELFVLFSYTLNPSKINKDARQFYSQHLEDPNIEPVETFNLLNKAIHKLNNNATVTHTLFRGTHLTQTLFNKIVADGVFVDNGFVSATSDVEKANTCIRRKNNDVPVIFEILHAKNSIDISPIMPHILQNEILFPQGSRFRLVKPPELTSDGHYKITIEELSPQFPHSITHLKDVSIEDQPEMGSTGPVFVVHPATGRWYVKKKGGTDAGLPQEHIAAEHAASLVYKIMRAKIPRAELYQEGDDSAVVSEFIERGVLLYDYLAANQYFKPNTFEPAEDQNDNVKSIIAQLKDHYVLDCLLGNYDVIGFNHDNVMVKDGIAHRIDHGASLDFSAGGDIKRSNRFSNTVHELDAFRGRIGSDSPYELDDFTYPHFQNMINIFKNISDAEIISQIEEILKNKEIILSVIPDRQLYEKGDDDKIKKSQTTLKDRMAGRIDYLRIYSDALKANAQQETSSPASKQPNTSSDGQLSKRQGTFPQDDSALRELPKKFQPFYGGTNPKYVRGESGPLFVRKYGGTDEDLAPEHAKNEYDASQIYLLFGAPIPKVEYYSDNGKPYILKEFVEGPLLQVQYDSEKTAPSTDIEKNIAAFNKFRMKKRIHSHFVLDCLLGNYDVIGYSFDNILIGKNEAPVRIDVGAAFDMTAHGSRKSMENFPDEVIELESFRGKGPFVDPDPELNPLHIQNLFTIFKGITNDEIIEQIDEILRKRDEFISALPDRKLYIKGEEHRTLKEKMNARIDYLGKYRKQLIDAKKPKK